MSHGMNPRMMQQHQQQQQQGGGSGAMSPPGMGVGVGVGGMGMGGSMQGQGGMGGGGGQQGVGMNMNNMNANVNPVLIQQLYAILRNPNHPMMRFVLQTVPGFETLPTNVQMQKLMMARVSCSPSCSYSRPYLVPFRTNK